MTTSAALRNGDDGSRTWGATAARLLPAPEAPPVWLMVIALVLTADDTGQRRRLRPRNGIGSRPQL